MVNGPISEPLFGVLTLWTVTLTQLEAFVLVARLGSVTAAARTLGVSEPAVSGALAALRTQFGDRLVERSPTGMVLTPGGRRLVGIASQMVALGAEAEAAIRQAQGAPEQLRVVATSTIAESVGPALLAAFTSRGAVVETSLGVASSAEMAAVLHERLADVALGPRITGEQAIGLESVPLFRYRFLLVAAPGHPLAGARGIAPRKLHEQTWLVDPDATDGASPTRRLLEQLQVDEARIRVFPSQASAWVAAGEGQGIAPAVGHLVAAELARGSLVELHVDGMPFELLWHATLLATDRRSPAAAGLRRFIGTPLATQAMHAPVGGVPPSRFRPPVYVTIWS
ncbi:MAG: transcriptional regulator, LysR family [Acidimicrobiales bacterium]|nr:transcriptional regulator, LysR family [Acidimicrobiales bacterium]